MDSAIGQYSGDVSVEPSPAGFETRLRPRGVGRWFSATFLAVWLSGWGLGEAFALWMLLAGAGVLVTGQPMLGIAEPVAILPATFIGLFLVVWLSLWTLGGYLAAREFPRWVSSEDHIIAGPDGLTVRHRIDPCRTTKVVPRASLTRVYAILRKQRVMAETTNGTLEITSHPLASELDTLVESIRRAAGRGAGTTPALKSLPENWCEVVNPDGGVSIVKGIQHRPAQARVESDDSDGDPWFTLSAVN